MNRAGSDLLPKQLPALYKRKGKTMGFLGGFLHKMTDGLTEGFKKYASKELAEGTMAALAMVAHANGEFKPEEKKKVLGFIKRDPSLKAFKQGDLLEMFNKHTENFEFDFGIGKEQAVKAIKLVTDEEAARLLVRGCVAIGAADGDFDKNEKDTVREICDLLGLQTSIFGL
jgi:tellurite resistance protein TerB